MERIYRYPNITYYWCRTHVAICVVDTVDGSTDHVRMLVNDMRVRNQDCAFVVCAATIRSPDKRTVTHEDLERVCQELDVPLFEIGEVDETDPSNPALRSMIEDVVRHVWFNECANDNV